mgnify:CR=1 FL=1
MCGVLGIAEWNGSILSHNIQPALDIISSRGPDDYGIVQEAWFQTAHRRLSILDLTWRGHQPFQDQSGRYLLVFNGEIYNYRELRQTLKTQGIVFQTESDTEVLIEKFAREGVSCFSDFHGMFAGAIFDRAKKVVYLFRDRLGVKPLYFTINDGLVAFASTSSAISYLFGGLSIDHAQLFNYMAFRSADVHSSFYVGVRALKPGTIVKIGEHETKEMTFWSLPQQFGKVETSMTEQDAVEGLAFFQQLKNEWFPTYLLALFSPVDWTPPL